MCLGLPKASADGIEHHLTEILSGFGVEELDGLSKSYSWQGGQGPRYGPKSPGGLFLLCILDRECGRGTAAKG